MQPENETRHTVSLFDRCPFSRDDYLVMNSMEDIYTIERTPAFYDWRVDGYTLHRFIYALARNNDHSLAGYLVMRERKTGLAEITDWRLFSDDFEERLSILSELLAPFMVYLKTIEAPLITPENNTSDLFVHLGFEYQTNTDDQPSMLARLCVKSFDDDLSDDDLLDASKWQLRFIDSDWATN